MQTNPEKVLASYLPVNLFLCPLYSKESSTTYQSSKLKHRLLKERIKEHKCERGALSEWLGKLIPLELHHIDGRYNNALPNLQLLCPNCHALTDNYRAKNIKNLSASAEMQKVEPLKFGETFQDS